MAPLPARLPNPSCGCEACGEAVASEAFRFLEMVLAVVQGSFHERVMLPLLGSAWYAAELQMDGSRSGSKSRITRARAKR
jgi:hypothetical protein